MFGISYDISNDVNPRTLMLIRALHLLVMLFDIFEAVS